MPPRSVRQVEGSKARPLASRILSYLSAKSHQHQALMYMQGRGHPAALGSLQGESRQRLLELHKGAPATLCTPLLGIPYAPCFLQPAEWMGSVPRFYLKSQAGGPFLVLKPSRMD